MSQYGLTQEQKSTLRKMLRSAMSYGDKLFEEAIKSSPPPPNWDRKVKRFRRHRNQRNLIVVNRKIRKAAKLRMKRYQKWEEEHLLPRHAPLPRLPLTAPVPRTATEASLMDPFVSYPIQRTRFIGPDEIIADHSRRTVYFGEGVYERWKREGKL